MQYQDYHRRYFARDLELIFRALPPAEARERTRFPNRVVSQLPGPVRVHFCLSMFGLSLAQRALDRHSLTAFEVFCKGLDYPIASRHLLHLHPMGWLGLALDERWTSAGNLQGEASNALHAMVRDIRTHWTDPGTFTDALAACLWLRGQLHGPDYSLDGTLREMAPVIRAARRRLFHSLDHIFHLTRTVRHDLCRHCAEGAFREWRGWPGQSPVPRLPEIAGAFCPRCGSSDMLSPDRIVFLPVGPTLGNPDHHILGIEPAHQQDRRLPRPYRKLLIVATLRETVDHAT